MLKRYRKAIVGVSGVLIVIGESLRDGEISGGEGFNIAVAVAVAFGVYRVPNDVKA